MSISNLRNRRSPSHTKAALSGLMIAVLLGAGITLAHAADGDADGIPDAAEVLLGTDPLVADTNGNGKNDKDDDTPLVMANPIPQTGKPSPLTFLSGIIENNVEPGNSKAADDHLELVIKNTSTTDIAGLTSFLTIKDDVAGTFENYFRKLPGVAIKAGQEITLHFDTKGSTDFAAVTDRFRSNPNSSLYKSPNPKTLTVQIATGGFAPATLDIHRDKGGAETAD